jgi:methylated-DNA-[protein]-cysteine S-methyltransferase
MGLNMLAFLDTVDSPAGPLSFAVDEDGALLFVSFLEGRYPTTIEQDLVREGYQIARDPARTAAARQQLTEYAAGTRQTFDLSVKLVGSEWQKAIWTALMEIPFGETRSYGDLARMLGRPQAARAVGRANGSNRIPLVIPCHRVIGADGTLTGFGGGLHLKTALLAHEARVLGRPDDAYSERARPRQLTLAT